MIKTTVDTKQTTSFVPILMFPRSDQRLLPWPVDIKRTAGKQ